MDKKLGKRHNKKRNTMLMYEFLIRHTSKCFLEKKNTEANSSLKLLKKYFSKGNVLHEELKLFKGLLNSSVKSPDSAHKIVEHCCRASKNYNVRKLDNEKSMLIKEVNHTFGKDVYNYKVPNYKVYASLQSLFNDSRSKTKQLTEIEKIQLKDSISEYILSEKAPREQIQKNETYDNAVYAYVVNNYHKKYDQHLSKNQKDYLMQYSLSLIADDRNKFVDQTKKQVKLITESLTNIKDEKILEDKELCEKITECKNKLSDLDLQNLSESDISTILQYMQLSEEVNS